jgi:lysophospholipase L1-like esterase
VSRATRRHSQKGAGIIAAAARASNRLRRLSFFRAAVYALRMRNQLNSLLALIALSVLARACAADAPFEFKANDRVVFIGGALVERDIQYNYLETMLTVRAHGKGVTFRNVGWAGDTVWGESRAVFGTQKDGYNSLIKLVNETRPTVVFLSYGFNESYAGPEGLAHFEEGYNALLDNVLTPARDAEYVAAPPAEAKNRRDPKDVPAGNKVLPREVPRVILISPIAFQPNDAPAAARNPKVNERVKLYADAIKKLAEKRGARYIDVFGDFAAGGSGLTNDGLHLTDAGYRTYAASVEKCLGLKPAAWPFNAALGGAYDSTALTRNPAGSVEAVRTPIAAKNLQFFNKWRPQNETYLFLFRKHEQGRNAKEIPEFDPYIEAKEAEIAKIADDVAKRLGL